MNRFEFSNGFDTLLNSYSGGIGIELTEYEKSFFLTEALDAFVKELYSSASGVISYECDERTRRLLEALVKTKEYKSSEATNNQTLEKGKFIHKVFTLDPLCWYIVYEEVNNSDTECEGLKISTVLPVTHDDYFRIVRNPFRGPTASRVLRLDKGDGEVELVSNFNNYVYRIRYIKRPKPIILQTLPKEASIDKIYDDSESDSEDLIDGVSAIIAQDNCCELPEQLHWDILDAAVKLAIARLTQFNNNSK